MNDSKWNQLILAVTAAVLLLSGPAHARDLLFGGATVHTVSGETFSPGQVLVRDGVIEAVGKEVDAPGDVTVIDLDGQHLYPGLIASTTSLGLTEINAVRATRDMSEVGAYTPDVLSWVAVNPDSELIFVARANGITHALPIPQGGRISGQSGLVALEGWTTEEMAVHHPVALHLFWPDMSLDSRPRQQFRDPSRWRSPEDQSRERQKQVQEIDSFFQEARAYAKALDAAEARGATRPEPDPSWDAMLPYVRGELPLMVHAGDVRAITHAVEWAGTNEFKVILAGGRDAWRAAEFLADEKIPVIFENVFTLPARDVDSFDVHFKAPAVLRGAGVPFAISDGISGFGAGLVRNLPYAAAQAAAYGLPELEAIRAITLYPAQILGVGDRLGSIEPGKEATFFAATGSILDIRSDVTRMWIAGQEVSLASRHTVLYEKYRNRPR